MSKMPGGEMGSASMQTDMTRMQEMHRMMQQWMQQAMNYARETKDPYSWCTYMNMMHSFEGHRKAMEQAMQAMREEQTAGQEQQMSQMHMKVAQAMMGEKMRM